MGRTSTPAPARGNVSPARAFLLCQRDQIDQAQVTHSAPRCDQLPGGHLLHTRRAIYLVADLRRSDDGVTTIGNPGNVGCDCGAPAVQLSVIIASGQWLPVKCRLKRRRSSESKPG